MLEVRYLSPRIGVVDPLLSSAPTQPMPTVQRSRTVGIVRPVSVMESFQSSRVGAGAWPERPIIGLERPFAATHAGSAELDPIGCLLPAILNRRNRPIAVLGDARIACRMQSFNV